MANKIGWCDKTINYVMGCGRKPLCPYCYAYNMHNRFKWTKDFNTPEWSEAVYRRKLPNKSSIIFLNSMSDIAFWKPEWIKKVQEVIFNNPDHKFITLTKNHNEYKRWEALQSHNYYRGITATQGRVDVSNAEILNIEPMHGPVQICGSLNNLQQIIIGAETGNRVGRIEPKEPWIKEIFKFAKNNGIKLYLKDNLKPFLCHTIFSQKRI